MDQEPQPRVTGIGGVFVKSDDPEELSEWYRRHLGLSIDENNVCCFPWKSADDGKEGMTVWSLFPRSSRYFGTEESTWMINYRVDDLHRVLAELRAEGVNVEPQVEESEYGKFGWAIDLDGNRFELWQPPED